jgi:hypothetical protein
VESVMAGSMMAQQYGQALVSAYDQVLKEK